MDVKDTENRLLAVYSCIAYILITFSIISWVLTFQISYGQDEAEETFFEAAIKGANNTDQRSFSGQANQTKAPMTNDTPSSLLLESAQLQQQDRLHIYENSSFGFKIEYPKDWLIVNEYKRIPDFENLQLGILFFSLPRGILADHNTTFWIETEYLPNRFMPLDKFVDSKLEGLYKEQASIISRDIINVAGRTAERVELSCCNSDQSLHETRIFLIYDELGYTLTYSAGPISFFPIFLSDAGNVVESFVLINSSDIVESENKAVEPNSDFVTYRDPSGYSIEYPSNWVSYSNSETDTMYVSDRIALVLISANSSVGHDMTIEDVANQFQSTIPANFKADISNYTLQGYPAIRIEYTGEIFHPIMGKTEQRAIGLGTIIDGKGFMVAAVAPFTEFSQYAPIFEHMINSFKIDK